MAVNSWKGYSASCRSLPSDRPWFGLGWKPVSRCGAGAPSDRSSHSHWLSSLRQPIRGQHRRMAEGPAAPPEPMLFTAVDRALTSRIFGANQEFLHLEKRARSPQRPSSLRCQSMWSETPCQYGSCWQAGAPRSSPMDPSGTSESTGPPIPRHANPADAARGRRPYPQSPPQSGLQSANHDDPQHGQRARTSAKEPRPTPNSPRGECPLRSVPSNHHRWVPSVTFYLRPHATTFHGGWP